MHTCKGLKHLHIIIDIVYFLLNLLRIKMVLNVKDDVVGFLWVLTERPDEHKIKLMQEILIKWIIEGIGITQTQKQNQQKFADKRVNFTDTSVNAIDVQKNMHPTALKRIGIYLSKL